MTRVHRGEAPHREGLWNLPQGARQVLLLAPPLLLAGFTVLHPQPDHNTQALMDASTWFMAYHMIQLALAGLVAVSVVLLADGFGRAGAWQTGIGLGVFLVFFSAYDTLAGIGTGLAMRSTRDLTAAEQDVVFSVVEDWPALDMWVFWLALAGTLGWILAVGYLAVSARAAGAPRLEWVCLGLAAFFLALGHPAPFGTIAFGCLFVAALVQVRRASGTHRLARAQAPAPEARAP
jgi:hypothetical protein